MATKLEYLKKYLAKPAEAEVPSFARHDAARPTKEKKKRKKGGADSFQIRDMSEVLPSARDEAGPRYVGAQAKLLSMDLDEDEVRLARDNELSFVDADSVTQAQKIDVEKSGVGWKMQNHKKPPRKQVIKEVKDEGGDSDFSPPRAQPKAKASDLSPPRRPAAAKTMPAKPVAARTRHDSDEDMSPPRRGAVEKDAKKEARADADLSPPRQKAPAQKQRHDSDSDMSPPRKAASGSQAEASKRQRHDSDADLSPPRGAKASVDVKKERHDSDADMSPPRKASKRQRHDSDADISPPRQPKAAGGRQLRQPDSDADLSPPKAGPRAAAAKSGRHDSDADLSPPRKGGTTRHDSDADDLSPPRQGRKDRGDVDENGEEKMSSGLRAGMISGKELKEETQRVKELRKAALAAAPDSETGRGADTVYRSKTGGKIGREEWVEQQGKKRKKRVSDYPEQQLAWGGGLKQDQNRDEEQQESLRVAAEPFARFELGKEAIQAQQDKQSWYDPMSKFSDDTDIGHATATAAAAAPAKPKCPHAPWPNRFGILPGYRWDGAVRGNTYEKRWIAAKNNREFTKTEKYKWERLED